MLNVLMYFFTGSLFVEVCAGYRYILDIFLIADVSEVFIPQSIILFDVRKMAV